MRVATMIDPHHPGAGDFATEDGLTGLEHVPVEGLNKRRQVRDGLTDGASEVLRDGQFLRIPMIVRDAAAIAAIAAEVLADIDKQTVSGALATATHGTGAAFGNLSTLMVGGRLVTADGSLREVGPGDSDSD